MKDINNITKQDKEDLTYNYLLTLGLINEGEAINNVNDFDVCIDEYIYYLCKTKTKLNPFWLVDGLDKLGYDLK